MTLIWGILGLGVIVFIHECGHFIAAKLTGITVTAFSIGMGPILLKKKIGSTDFRLSAFPIGGYCLLKGEKSYQQAIDANLPQIPKEPHSFYENPIKRFIISFAGPFANFLFAIIAFTCISLIGYSYQSTTSRVLLVTDIYPEMHSVAADAGILSGDTITVINGKAITNFSDLYAIIATHPDETMTITVGRNGIMKEISLKTDMDEAAASGKIGVMSWVDPIVAAVKPDSPAALAGLIPSDTILTVNGTNIANTAEFQKCLSGKKSVNLTVLRQSLTYEKQIISIELPVTINSKTGEYTIGISFPSITVDVQEHSLFGAFASGVNETINMMTLTLKTITWLFKGIDISSAVSGPIQISFMFGEAAEEGFSAGFSEGLIIILNFLSLISISLFIMNLLPIPILDGGIMLFALIEIIRGKGISPTVLYRIQIAGIIIFGFLFIIAITGDIQYVFRKIQNLFVKY